MAGRQVYHFANGVVAERLTMGKIAPLIQGVCVLLAASILGNWFLVELKRSRALGKPWYAGYLTIPGIIIICIILLLPFIIRLRAA
jgi:hypothetical protein